MTPRYLTATEYQVIPIGDASHALSATDVQRLVQMGTKRPGFCTLGHRNVRLAQFAGLVQLNGRILEILPKVGESGDIARSRGTLLRLLSMAHGLQLTTSGSVAHQLQRQSLLDVFIAAFLQEVSTLVRGGLIRRYRSEENDLPLIRGRLNIKRQVTALAMRVDRLACRFDDLTLDNPWNQVLKAALLALRPWIRQLDTGRRWMELAAAFDEVTTCRNALALFEGLELDRQVRHYASAAQWAEWILRLLSPNLRAGESSAPELLFDMNQLFEKAVAAKLKRGAQQAGLRLSSQDTGQHLVRSVGFGELPHFGLRPDLVLRNGRSVVSVGDTKWTRVAIGTSGRMLPAEAHMYQLNAYASVYPSAELALIYPFDDTAPSSSATAYRLSDKGGEPQLLHVLCIDVASDGLPLIGGHHASTMASALMGE